jgi:hypothetical protein
MVSATDPMNSSCSTCGAAAPKYCCPGCSLQSCSLACCKAHKAATGCTGKRDALKYVNIKELGDRELLSGKFLRTLSACLAYDVYLHEHRAPGLTVKQHDTDVNERDE